MATIALPRPIAPHRPSSSLGSMTTTITLDAISTQAAPRAAPTPLPAPVPNKHIPVCPPGPVPPQLPEASSPASPGQREVDRARKGRGKGKRTEGDGEVDGFNGSDAEENEDLDDEYVGSRQKSLLYPPDNYTRMERGQLALYQIDAAGVAEALDYASRQPLPDPSRVFPWLHGLHPKNHIQQSFFLSRRKGLGRTPCCLRGVTVVKADGRLDVSRIKGAIAPGEILQPDAPAEFLDADPREGFSVRNFQIQPTKTAMTSDIIVYGGGSDGDGLGSSAGADDAVWKLGWDIAAAQHRWRERSEAQGVRLPVYNTFVCTSTFGEFEAGHADIVAVDSAGRAGPVVSFLDQERREMYDMTKASEISHNVWLGPTPDMLDIAPAEGMNGGEPPQFDILIECSDAGQLNPMALQALAEGAGIGVDSQQVPTPPMFDFPSSGSILAPTWSHAEADAILETCKWIYCLAHGTHPSAWQTGGQEDTDGAGDIHMSEATREKKILIHCTDGYTESTMLAIAYFSYSTGRPVPEAWLDLHTTMRRNFFAYTTDVSLLTALAPRLLRESPVCAHESLSAITAMVRDEPRWLSGLDGSLPSRVLDYMYLGNLGHANNPDLLKAMGIRQILSVGEAPMWRDGELESWGLENTCVVQAVQDNGIDPLTGDFERCLEFIDRGRRTGTATLVHCRVGVSRSATVCIAEVMRSMDMSFPRAYCFVRARRLNVIIQPHLRFAYELLKWEELLQSKEAAEGGQGVKRELEWSEISREIALMNRPYAR